MGFLFHLQPEDYRNRIVTAADRMDSTVITTRARELMNDWIFNHVAADYALSSDWDDRWRTSGTLDEARLSPDWLLEGIERFVSSRELRLERLKEELDSANLSAQVEKISS